jgi:amino acid adenylation domain-containing protein
MVQQAHPVSFAQQRLWFLDQLEPGSSAYNLPFAIRVTGNLNLDAFRRALQAIVQRHESLRTTFAAVDGEVMALVAAVPAPIEAPLVSLEHLPEHQREDRALVIAAEEGQRSFDLSAGPLLRNLLVRLSPTQHVLVLTMHHIATDGWSMGVLFREIGAFYRAFSSDREPDLPALPTQYGDFARWQRESVAEDLTARQLEYWRQALSGAPAVFDLPSDRQRLAVQTHRGSRHSVNLDEGLASGLAQFSRSEQVTLFITLLAAFETLLWRYTGVSDFVLGTPLAGRGDVDLEPLIGVFVQTAPLRANLGGNPTFRDLLHRVRETTFDAMARDVPFERIVQDLRPERSLSRTPLFQVMFILHNTPRHSMDLPGLQFDELDFDPGLAKFDLTLEVREHELDGLYCAWEYSTDLFDHDRIVRMAENFETLLRGIIAAPSSRLSELPILTDRERNRLLLEWNATATSYPDDICIHQAFEAQVVRSANSIAIRGEDCELTYRELNDEANCLANYIRRLGVRPMDFVGVATERSVDAVVAILAVMKAGASYVPIDPRYPKHRIEFMLKDCAAPLLITQHRLRTRLPECACRTVFLDRDRTAILAESCRNPQLSLDCCDSGYMIYTSGSTGIPKGVLGTHRASMNRFAWMWKAYPFAADDVCAQRSSLSFVDSICEIFGPLLQGVPIFIIPDDTAIDSKELVHQLATQRITRLVVVPSQLGAILEACADSEMRLPSLRLCFTSGEALPYSLYERFTEVIPHARLINLYGSSEVAADVTCFDTAANEPQHTVPIGKPIANVRVYILDQYLNPVPIGVPGEIYVAGDCLARGYLNQPELTAERFIADPFCPGGLLYQTGDLGRYQADGNIEFLGRADNQVKIGGVRIELGEIESVLREHDSIRHVAVIAHEAGAMGHALVAYVVPVSAHKVVPSEWRRHLKAKLPEYMVPAAFVTLEALPMTPNGKLDQRLLPSFASARLETHDEYVAPRNDLETKLVEIWAEVLQIKRIGVVDNFFELGGHSLMAAQVIARMRKYLGAEVQMRSLFEEPTVAALAIAVEKSRADGRTPRPRITAVRSELGSREELARRLQGLSDEEIDALLKTALAARSQVSSSGG